jgi:hypothetical protein
MCCAVLLTLLHLRCSYGPCFSGRPKPGLGHQHATGVKLVAQGCGAVVDPPELLFGAHLEGATSFRLWLVNGDVSVVNASHRTCEKSGPIEPWPWDLCDGELFGLILF